MSDSATPQTVRQGPFTVVLIGPDDARRQGMVRALAEHPVLVVREFSSYPALEQLQSLASSNCDALIIDVSHEPAAALGLIEKICSRNDAVTVMAYARRQDDQMLVRCMRAGAREWLAEPVSNSVLAEALKRVAARKAELSVRTPVGKVLLFWGAKGGSGATTLAVNFALLLRQECQQNVALVDLNLQLGEVAVLLGLKPRYSVLDALQNRHRLDTEFLSSLAVTHSSGLVILPASDEYDPGFMADVDGLSRLLWVLREQFAYVVVDAGPALGAAAPLVMNIAETVYLVTQVEMGALRNCRRLMPHFHRNGRERVEVVANRFDARRLDITEDQIQTALGITFRWKVPNQYPVVRRAHNSGVPLAEAGSPVVNVLRDMARAACGKQAVAARRAVHSLLSLI